MFHVDYKTVACDVLSPEGQVLHFFDSVSRSLIGKHNIVLQGLWMVSEEKFWDIMGHL
jgi:hypothetical protein